MNESTLPPSRWLKALAVAVRGLSWFLGTLLLLLALAWGALQWWIVPRINDWRPQLEIWAGQALGVPVRIGALSAQAHALMPTFELRELALLDPQGREALRLPRVRLALSLPSLMNLGFEQFVVDAPELEIRRTAQGRLVVAGLAVDAGRSGDSPAIDWFFRQREFVIRHGTVRWIDEMQGAAPLALAGVDVVMRNGVRRHDMRLDATPPPGWGDRFTLIGRFRRPVLSRHASQWSDWSGVLFGDFSRVDVSQLHRYTRVAIDVVQGEGAVRLWADLRHGRFVGGDADVALSQASAILGPKLAPLALRGVSGRLGGRRFADGFEIYTEGLRFRTADGLQWPGGNVHLSYTAARGRVPAQGQLRADRLDLSALSQIADRLPLGDGLRGQLRAHAPRGLMDSLQASWQGDWPAPQGYQLRGHVSALALAAVAAPAAAPAQPPRPGIPGLRGATVDFDLNQSGGHASLVMAGGALEFPGVFEESLIPMDRLAAEAQWQRDGDALSISQASVSLANADAEGVFRGSWRTSDPRSAAGRSRFPGVLDLQGSFSRLDGARVYRYLPLVLAQSARDYVRDAVREGQAKGVAVRIKGDLNDLPFAHGRQGEFHIGGQVQGVTLAYVPPSLQHEGDRPWPALTDLGGELVFDRQGMQVRNAHARVAGLAGLKIPRVEARIADLAHTTVEVDGELKGPLAEGLAFVKGSPLGALMGGALDQARATGDAGYRLRLSLPVHTIRDSRVQGSVTLAGNELQITPQTPVLRQTRGVVSFSESGLSIAGAQGRMLGGDVRLDGALRMHLAPHEAVPVLRIRGNVTADGLRQATELGPIAQLAQRAAGATSYTAQLGLRHGVPELAVSSSLQGLALSLPAPLTKGPEAALPLTLRRTASEHAGALQDQWQMTLGPLAAVAYQRDLSGPKARVLRGSIGIGLAPGEELPLPEAGVVASVRLDQFDLDAWQALLPKGGGGAAAAQADASGQDYLPTRVALRARTLTTQGRTLHNVVVGGSREGRFWRANLDATELSGYLEYRQSDETTPGGVYARLSRLIIGPAAASDVEALLEEPPVTLPALDIVVEHFELRGKPLGRLEVEAVNRNAGTSEAGREWRLNRLNLSVPEAQLNASGRWALDATQPASRRMSMNFRLDVADAGVLLTRLGMTDVLRHGKGRLEGLMAWNGSPLALHYPSMSGSLHLDVASGQFLKADPGLAKLLGVLSLQSLPRRLTLDFRDVFSEGFAFDFVRGDVNIERGVARTNNLQMKGVNAAVLMEGSADIAHETQDLRVVVVPEIDAGTASLVAGVINPAVGLGTYLAQQFLRRPLAQAATQQFHIDGTWVDPRITRVAPAEGGTR